MVKDIYLIDLNKFFSFYYYAMLITVWLSACVLLIQKIKQNFNQLITGRVVY